MAWVTLLPALTVLPLPQLGHVPANCSSPTDRTAATNVIGIAYKCKVSAHLYVVYSLLSHILIYCVCVCVYMRTCMCGGGEKLHFRDILRDKEIYVNQAS